MFCVTVVDCAFVNTTNIAHCLFTIKMHSWHIPCVFDVEKCTFVEQNSVIVTHVCWAMCGTDWLIDFCVECHSTHGESIDEWFSSHNLCVLKWSMLNSAGVECEAEMIWCNVSKHDKKDTQMFEHKTHWQNQTVFVLKQHLDQQPACSCHFVLGTPDHSHRFDRMSSFAELAFWILTFAMFLTCLFSTQHITSCVALSHQATISRFMW